MYQPENKSLARSPHRSGLAPSMPIFPRHFHPQACAEDLYACPDAGATPVSSRAAGFLLAASLLFWLAVLAGVAWSVRQPAGEAGLTASPEPAGSRLPYPGGTLVTVLVDLLACDPHNCGDAHPRVSSGGLAHSSQKTALQHPNLQSQCWRTFLVRSIQSRQTWLHSCWWLGLPLV